MPINHASICQSILPKIQLSINLSIIREENWANRREALVSRLMKETGLPSWPLQKYISNKFVKDYDTRNLPLRSRAESATPEQRQFIEDLVDKISKKELKAREAYAAMRENTGLSAGRLYSIVKRIRTKQRESVS